MAHDLALSAPLSMLCSHPAASQLVRGHSGVHSTEQPNFPNLDHRTPWTNLVPTLSGSGRYLLVAAGPIRLLAVVGACALAVLLRRRLTGSRNPPLGMQRPCSCFEVRDRVGDGRLLPVAY